MKLYEIEGRYRALLEEIEALEGEVTDAHAAEFAELEGDLREKLDACMQVVAVHEGHVSVLDAEIKRLQARKKSAQGTVERVRSLAMRAMVTAGMEKVRTALFSFSVSPTQGEVMVDDVSSLPERFTRVSVEVNRTELRKALEAGEAVEGARIVPGKKLVVR